MTSRARAVLAEGCGTAILLATVVGSGAMASALADGNDAVALLANALATAAALYVLIELLAPISGAHFNPLVSLVLAYRRELSAKLAGAYVVAQLAGAIAGVLLAHAMFDLPLWQPGVRERSGTGIWLSEGVATGGLIAVIVMGSALRPKAVPVLVASWIFAAYWFTASTAFANPAVTVARALTRTFAGIRPSDVGWFVVAQVLGAVVGALAAHAILGRAPAKPLIDQRDRSGR